MSPGATSACATILFAVDVPLVTKYVRRAPNVSAASCCALAQRPGRLEQRIEAAAGRRGLGQEDVQAVEADHVADPVRADDRVALGDRQRMEHPGRAVAVVPQRLEERRRYRAATPGQDAQVQLQRAFLGVEDPAEVMAEVPGDVLDRDLRHQVQVELGPQPGQPPGQDLGALSAAAGPPGRGDTGCRRNRRGWTGPARRPGANRRRMTLACRFAFSRAAMTASSALPTMTSS